MCARGLLTVLNRLNNSVRLQVNTNIYQQRENIVEMFNKFKQTVFISSHYKYIKRNRYQSILLHDCSYSVILRVSLHQASASAL